ncbi:YitT family protein [Amedibacillus sp. YH-ame10]
MIIAGNLLITTAYAFITVPHEIINGGITSFSMVLQNLTSWDVTIFTNGITIILLIACYLWLGKEYFYKSILSSACYMLFFNIFHAMNFVIQLPQAMCVIIAAIMVGSGYMLCIKAKSTTVGFDVLAIIFHHRDETISIAKMMRAINIVVILLGLLSYGWLAIITGILFTILQTKTLDVLLNVTINPKKLKHVFIANIK